MIDINTQWMLVRDAQLCGDDSEQNVSWRKQIDGALANVHTCCPGIISSFDPATMTAEVQPAIQKLIYRDNAPGQWVNMPLLVDVPVVIPTAGGFSLTFPIHPGDECLLLFAERSFDNWHEQGGIAAQVDARTHSLSDGFALMGVRSKANLIKNYNTTDVELRDEAGQTRINLNGSSATVTAPATDVEGNLNVSTGASGSFTTTTGMVVTVVNGIVISMV